MDNQRLFIWAFFVMMGWITYQTWVKDYAPRPTQPVAEQTAETTGPLSVNESGDDMPEISDAPAGAEAMPAAPGDTQDVATAPTAPTISVTTDVFNIQISTQGGTLQGATLSKYPVEKDRPDEPVRLLERKRHTSRCSRPRDRATSWVMRTSSSCRSHGPTRAG
jgi:YidC/Oxa1 family membrane protein insertase